MEDLFLSLDMPPPFYPSFNGFCLAKASVAAAAMSTKGTKKFKNSTGVWEEGVWHGFKASIFVKKIRDGFLVFHLKLQSFTKKKYNICVYLQVFSLRNFPTKDSTTYI